MSRSSIVPGENLVFFDEIQECSRAIMSLRYCKKQLPALHVVAAGSLPEFALGEISFPVSRVDYEVLFPVSFREFLEGTGRWRLVGFLPEPLRNFELPPNAMARLLDEA